MKLKSWILAFAILGFAMNNLQAQKWLQEAGAFQDELNHAYRDSAHSPLKGDDFVNFKEHNFFPISKEFVVKATFLRTSKEAPFDMMTSSGKTKRFVKYGEFHFTLKGQELKLSAYQRLLGPNADQGAEELFIPFKDHTSGEESYGGGRYMDVPIPRKKHVVLDFNRCYNPYCAYSTGWNCPIPPQENYLEIKILAGVKAWIGH